VERLGGLRAVSNPMKLASSLTNRYLEVEGIELFQVTDGLSTITLEPGVSLFAIPRSTGNNTIAELLPQPPEGTILYRFHQVTQSFSLNAFDFGSWSNPTQVLEPGQAAFLSNPGIEPIRLDLHGTPAAVRRMSNRIPGFHLVGGVGNGVCASVAVREDNRATATTSTATVTGLRTEHINCIRIPQAT
jgi:hypothetical protein